MKCTTYIYVLFSLWLASCLPRNVKDKHVKEYASNTKFTKRDKIILTSGKEIRTIYTARDSSPKPLLVFIHGAPGNVLNYKKYHEDSLLNKKYNILSYDRPGYGTRKGGRAITTLKGQSAVLREVVAHYPSPSLVLFAHSFGGAIALHFAGQNKNVKRMLLCAVAVDPEKEKYFWFSKIGKWRFTRLFLPRYLKTTGSEKYSHEEELNKLHPLLKNVNCEVSIYHGDKDEVVPLENVDYLKRELTNSRLTITVFKNTDHFFPSGYLSIMVNELLKK